MSNSADEQSIREAEEADDTVERVSKQGKEQTASAENAEQGGSEADRMAKKIQVPDPNARPAKDA